MTVDGTVHRFPEPTIAMRLRGERDWLPRSTLPTALDAVFGLADLVEPLSLDVQLGFLRDGNRRERNLWLRLRHPVARDLDPSYTTRELIELTSLDRTRVEGVLLEGVGEAEGAGETLAWYEIEMRASRARLPEPSRHAGRSVLRLETEYGDREVPIEQAQWVAGPARLVPAPVMLTIHGEEYDVTLELRLAWSLWTEQDSPGRARVEREIVALERQGWEREDG